MAKNKQIDLLALARAAMEQYGFQTVFPPAALREAESLQEERISEGVDPSVRDLRPLLWSSIDNADSLDLDQLEFCGETGNGEIEVKIAIADVDALVPKDSGIDEHANRNGTSVYTGIETFPMLPARLSTQLSSLLPGADRLALVVEFSVGADGRFSSGPIYRALVRNKAKLVYEDIGRWLEAKAPVPQAVGQTPGLEEQLRLQEKAAQRLGDLRQQQGSLELETIEARVVIREGAVADLAVPEDNPARHIIENFMVAANQTMSAFLEKAGAPAIQRVVRVPKNWPGIVETARELGEELPAEADGRALSGFLLRAKTKDPERFPDLSLTVVKLLGSGEYLALGSGREPLGHFGLAVVDYTHSTAPNRRFVDMVIQRLTKSVLAGEKLPYSFQELGEIANWCTQRDQSAKKVERFMRKAGAAVFLSGRLGEVFDALVTGASPKGCYARVISPPFEGRIVRREEGLKVGQKVRVRLLSLDPSRGFIDLEKA